MDFAPSLVHESEVPLYRQLYQQFAAKIRSGELPRGERLPATRELAGLLGLNRTTVSAAYEMLESEGLIAGQVGRGSFVTGLEDVLGWTGARIRAFFAANGFAVREWEKVRTDTITLSATGTESASQSAAV